MSPRAAEPPTRLANASENGSAATIAVPVFPNRPVAISRKLTRTDSPTSAEPASVAVAIANPATTAAFVRQ